MLEGLTLGTEWDWKDTLGPLRNRPGFQGVWGYQQTHGLGLVEYLESVSYTHLTLPTIYSV